MTERDRRRRLDGLQSIPKESNDKDVAAMLDELTIEVNEETFVIVLQHGGNDLNRDPRYKRTVGQVEMSLICHQQRTRQELVIR